MSIFSVQIENAKQPRLSTMQTFDVNCQWWNAIQTVQRSLTVMECSRDGDERRPNVVTWRDNSANKGPGFALDRAR